MEDEVALFNDSLERCMGRPEFLDRFYELFLSSSPEVAAKFVHTDFAKQKRLLKASLYMLMVASEGNSGGYAHLTHLAKRHSRQELNIRPELYDLWLASLVQAVRECDSQWTPQTEQVWRRIMQPGIAFMKAAFE